MRLLVAFLWSLATVMWLPWFAVFVRLLVDLFSGVPLTQSEYLDPAFVPFWPVHSWYLWDVLSWVPVVWLLSMLLVYIGWRFFWWADDWIPSYRTPAVALTILVPPVAPILLYRDARHRFSQRNAGLQDAVEDAIERSDEQELRLVR